MYRLCLYSQKSPYRDFVNIYIQICMYLTMYRLCLYSQRSPYRDFVVFFPKKKSLKSLQKATL